MLRNETVSRDSTFFFGSRRFNAGFGDERFLWSDNTQKVFDRAGQGLSNGIKKVEIGPELTELNELKDASFRVTQTVYCPYI